MLPGSLTVGVLGGLTPPARLDPPLGGEIEHLPADHPAAPAPRANSAQLTAAVRGGQLSASTSKASVSKASPARIAKASPNCLWQVGKPRRRSSSSIAGRSSWISEYVWTISTAHAAGNARSAVPPAASHARIASKGRSRFPGARRLYPIASTRTRGASAVWAGRACPAGPPRSRPAAVAARPTGHRTRTSLPFARTPLLIAEPPPPAHRPRGRQTDPILIHLFPNPAAGRPPRRTAARAVSIDATCSNGCNSGPPSSATPASSRTRCSASFELAVTEPQQRRRRVRSGRANLRGWWCRLPGRGGCVRVRPAPARSGAVRGRRSRAWSHPVQAAKSVVPDATSRHRRRRAGDLPGREPGDDDITQVARPRRRGRSRPSAVRVRL